MRSLQHRIDVAVRLRGDDLEALLDRREGFPTQRAAHEIDDMVGQMRKIAECLVLDLVAVTVASTQQMCRIDATLVSGAA
jgi:hypothetical protein